MNSLQCITFLRYPARKSLNQISQQQLTHLRHTSTSDLNSSNKIVIPKRIERGPTDILKALSDTVKQDYTAPHFKYHDDPFLIPTSNMAKRMYALSQESGRKAAQWVRQEHAELFQHKVADPYIEAFSPRAIYDEKSEVDESTLQKVIAQHLVSDALTIYGLLEEKSVELTRETKQSLLELLCYYNNQDSLEEDWIEERWFKQAVKGREKKMNNWKKGSTAEKLFASISPPDAASYAALLCGKAVHGDMDGAQRLYQEAVDAGIALPVQVFNRLIAGAPVLKEAHELRWNIVEDLLATMQQQGVSPNLDTLNAILSTISSMSVNQYSQKNALAILAEFKLLGIEPSLASYYFLLNIFCHDKSGMRSGVLVDILNILEGKSLSIRDPRDVLFFSEAMAICRLHLRDIDTAYRLDNLLHTADNYNLIGDSFKESVYYRFFFFLICQMGTLKEFWELYNKLVPNIYVPEPAVMEEIINTVELNEAFELLPRLWTDLLMFEHMDRESILVAMLRALQKSQSVEPSMLDKFADVAWDIWQRVESQKQQKITRKINWTGPMLGDIVQVLLRADRYDQALDIMTCLDRRQQEILGVPSFESLNDFLNKSIEKKEIKNAIWCIQYCADAGFEDTIKLASNLSTSVELSENERNTLVGIVGHEALKKQSVSAS